MSNLEKGSQENSIDSNIYKQSKKQLLFLIGIPLISFSLFLLFTLPLKEKTISLLEKYILKTRSCFMNYESINLNILFFPTLSLKNLTIPKRCNKTVFPSAVTLDSVLGQITFPSFWPIGLKTKISIQKGQSSINIYPRLTISGHTFQIENTAITSELVTQLISSPLSFDGKINIKGNLETKENKIQNAHFLAASNNLFFPKQSLFGIEIPSLPLKKFGLAFQIIKNELQIKALKIGNTESPLQGEFEGKINLSSRNIRSSQLQLKGRIKITELITDAIPLIRLFLNGKEREDGYYYLSIKGSFNSPQLKVIDP